MLTDHLPGQHADGGGGDVLRFQLPVYPLTAEHGGRQGAEYPGALLSGEPLCLDVGHQIHLATLLEYGASIIALVAIFKSFFGHYLGTLEGLNGLILRFGYKGDKTRVSSGKLNTLSMVFIMGSTWVVAYANPNILDLIEAMGAPIIASLLCLLPMYAIRKAPSLAKYRGRLDNLFVTAIGLLTILNIAYKLF